MGGILKKMLKIIIEKIKEFLFGKPNELKGWLCKDGRIVYGTKCSNCGKRTNLRNKKLAQSKYICRECSK